MRKVAEKTFAVGFTVSCKNLRCTPEDEKCSECIETIIDEQIRLMSNFRCSMITTSNNSRQFNASFTAVCRKPDCTAIDTDYGYCCTANADKCEFCLRSIVVRGIREMNGFHVKEIAVL